MEYIKLCNLAGLDPAYVEQVRKSYLDGVVCQSPPTDVAALVGEVTRSTSQRVVGVVPANNGRAHGLGLRVDGNPVIVEDYLQDHGFADACAINPACCFVRSYRAGDTDETKDPMEVIR